MRARSSPSATGPRTCHFVARPVVGLISGSLEKYANFRWRRYIRLSARVSRVLRWRPNCLAPTKSHAGPIDLASGDRSLCKAECAGKQRVVGRRCHDWAAPVARNGGVEVLPEPPGLCGWLLPSSDRKQGGAVEPHVASSAPTGNRS